MGKAWRVHSEVFRPRHRKGSLLKSEEFECRVSSAGRRGVTVVDAQGRETPARVAGKVYRQTQPVAGDRAVAVRTGDIPLILRVLPRTGVLQRASSAGGPARTIAANVDDVLVLCSLREPGFSEGFLSRALVAARWRHLDSIVVLNKLDLLRGAGDEMIRKRVSSVYGAGGAGYPVFEVSCVDGTGTDRLLRHMNGRTVVMTGPSGAGKTSLAKVFIPSLDMRIGDLSPKTGSGRHTTVSARLIPLDGSTALIDTPGLSLFSVDHIPAAELQFCFPEFDGFLGECRFRDCLHLSEPGCAVKSAVEDGRVDRTRYAIYSDLMSRKGI